MTTGMDVDHALPREHLWIVRKSAKTRILRQREKTIIRADVETFERPFLAPSDAGSKRRGKREQKTWRISLAASTSIC
jgi:hypothetical protein